MTTQNAPQNYHEQLHRVPLHRSILPLIAHHRPSHTKKDGTFEVSVDLQHFDSKDIKVKIVDNKIVVEGHHDEREDDHGLVERHFVRRYTLPDAYDGDNVVSTLSSDGMLVIKASPRLPDEADHKKVDIKLTGKKHSDYYMYHEDSRG
jgi:hypothetical protein